MKHGHDFERLISFLERLPAIYLPAGRKSIGSGVFESGNWWVTFRLNLDHPLAWRHVQEFGFVLNLLSNTEQLPTIFKPVSPPPYLNGGAEFLSWVIESTSPEFIPALCAEWLEGRLPRPVDDSHQWEMNLDEEAGEESNG
jgi:hypothetical protein